MADIPTREQLFSAITAHYTDREFPSSALNCLIATVKKHCQRDGTIEFRGNYQLKTTVSKLLEEPPAFPRCSCAASPKEKIVDSDAIFAFSCGYRLRKYSDGGAQARLPGSNNRELAKIAVELKSELQRPLYAQFEIADAIEDYTEAIADYRTPTEAMGTSDAIKYFLDHRIIEGGGQFRKVIVVAHQHHIGRCLILLNEDFGIEAYPYGRSYDQYDQRECQRRAKSPNELIVSDFVSMAARAQ